MLELRQPDIHEITARKAKLLERARSACEYLKSLGAEEVYLFGSITRDDFDLHSDVDIAVRGLPFHFVYAVEGKIGDILDTDEFDLVYLEYAKKRLRERVYEQGVRVC